MKFWRLFANSMVDRARPAASPVACIQPNGVSPRRPAVVVEGTTSTTPEPQQAFKAPCDGPRWSMRAGFLPFLQVDPGVVVSLLLFRVPFPRFVGLPERTLVGLLSRIVRSGFLAHKSSSVVQG